MCAEPTERHPQGLPNGRMVSRRTDRLRVRSPSKRELINSGWIFLVITRSIPMICAVSPCFSKRWSPSVCSRRICKFHRVSDEPSQSITLADEIFVTRSVYPAVSMARQPRQAVRSFQSVTSWISWCTQTKVRCSSTYVTSSSSLALGHSTIRSRVV